MIEAAHERAVGIREVKDLDPLIDRLSRAKVVMLGEATHGTQEFYHWRRLITEWLIVKHGFRLVAIEGDWPPCQELNQYIQSRHATSVGAGIGARGALGAFRRWPTWMWANTEMARLAEWLKEQNHIRKSHLEPTIGFHGLDVYSLFESMDVILEKLKSINPFLARLTRQRFACFDPFMRDERAYARSLIRLPQGCEQEVAQVLQDLLELRAQETSEKILDLQQNARIIQNAERYYRSQIHADENSWNIRDSHMMETLSLLLDKYDSKAIVWAHNTHIGDYRATEMAESGMINLGGLAREKLGNQNVALLGFGTYQGSVIASHAWDGPIQKLSVPAARAGSLESALHQVSERMRANEFFLTFDPESRVGPLADACDHRAIGVVYDPAHERSSNYVATSFSNRYDAFLFVDQSEALEPLILEFRREEIPGTWPAGL